MPDLPFKISTTNFDPALAEVTLQYLNDDLAGEVNTLVKLQGRIVGPFCVDRTTVATAHALEVAPDASNTLRGRLPDPCFWTPETPFLYHLEVEVIGEPSLRYSIPWGIQSIQIKRRHFNMNGQRYALRVVKLTRPLTPDLAKQLRQRTVNAIVLPLEVLLKDENIPTVADLLGLHMLYEAQPDEEAMLWYAESHLSLHISTLGYLLPQASMQNPQLWHNAMLHLHRQRRGIFVGIELDAVPLNMVQGHVEYMVVPMQYLDDVASVAVPKLASVRRFDLLNEELAPNLAGRVSRVMPDD